METSERSCEEAALQRQLYKGHFNKVPLQTTALKRQPVTDHFKGHTKYMKNV